MSPNYEQEKVRVFWKWPKYESNIAFMKSQRTSQHGTQNVKIHNSTTQKN